MILDGRSTEPGSAPTLLEMLSSKMEEIGIGQIVILHWSRISTGPGWELRQD